ncbi:MAG: AbrB/MazE/SpoVT family DNA-binding domain-containing protein [Firmicutes bacterium]|nr:AbrB/MazE/SpoVT family DNA-binding domain-containing protein [Bacillota bacterium]
MECTRLSSKGQVVIPKAIRAAHRWGPGTELVVEDRGDAIILRPARPFAPTRVEDVLGCAGYKGPKRTLKEMESAIARGAREQR